MNEIIALCDQIIASAQSVVLRADGFGLDNMVQLTGIQQAARQIRKAAAQPAPEKGVADDG